MFEAATKQLLMMLGRVSSELSKETPLGQKKSVCDHVGGNVGKSVLRQRGMRNASSVNKGSDYMSSDSISVYPSSDSGHCTESGSDTFGKARESRERLERQDLKQWRETDRTRREGMKDMVMDKQKETYLQETKTLIEDTPSQTESQLSVTPKNQIEIDNKVIIKIIHTPPPYARYSPAKRSASISHPALARQKEKTLGKTKDLIKDLPGQIRNQQLMTPMNKIEADNKVIIKIRSISPPSHRYSHAKRSASISHTAMTDRIVRDTKGTVRVPVPFIRTGNGILHSIL